MQSVQGEFFELQSVQQAPVCSRFAQDRLSENKSVQMRILRQGIQETLRLGETHAGSYWRETFQMPHLQEEFPTGAQFDQTHDNPHER